MSHTIGGAVFLSNVDDFVSPSQACVNPLYSGETEDPVMAATTPSLPENLVVRRQTTEKNNINKKNKMGPPTDVVTATLTDCLACSGCVTTAETVLMEEQHNLSKLVDAVDAKRPILITFSPAARADWERSSGNPLDISAWRHQLGVMAVMDGNVPLQWSRTAAVEEFVQAYRQQQSSTSSASEPSTETWERQLVPSKALGNHRTEYYLASSSTPTAQDHPPQLRAQQQFPILSSSCPAIVCFMEKSHHAGVPQLSVAASPMIMAASAVASSDDAIFHLAVQPCHDKKLEAGRLDFAETVDLVLTTTEFYNFVQERVVAAPGNKYIPPVQRHISTPQQLSNIVRVEKEAMKNGEDGDAPGILCVPPNLLSAPQPPQSNQTGEEPFVWGSGGYADFIFRQAAWNLWGIRVVPVWKSPPQQQAQRRRRRTRQRELYQATLYRHKTDGTFTCEDQQPDNNYQVIWRFAMAHGMQTVQRLLNEQQDQSYFHYVELMACAGSCLNGAGQCTTTPETPTETRERLAISRAHLLRVADDDPMTATTMPAHPYTTYHVVPPLHHARGAAAGIAVQDTVW